MTMFYRVPKAVFSDRGEHTVSPSQFNSVVLYRGRRWCYLHGQQSTELWEQLQQLGAEQIADTWGELKTSLTIAQRRAVFRKLVRRDVLDDDGNTVNRELDVEQGDTQTGDVVTQDWMPPHAFLGDPSPAPVD